MKAATLGGHDASAVDTRGNIRGQRTRRRLLDAALTAFSTHGFHGTGTREIAEAAGMSPAALYTHYDTKEALLFALSLRGHHEARTVVTGALAPDRSAADELHAVVAAYTAWHAREHVMARVVQYEMASLEPEHYAEIATIRRDIVLTVRRIIRRGTRCGDFTVDHLGLATLAILSLGVDVARWYRDDGRWTPESIGTHYGALALGMVGAHLSRSQNARMPRGSGSADYNHD
jgi:AcrR family transcriptional regulator